MQNLILSDILFNFWFSFSKFSSNPDIISYFFIFIYATST